MNTFFPGTGSEAEWNAAYYRLEDYLRALHVVNKVHQSQIILSILRRAAEKHALNPQVSPTELAFEEACARIDEWFKKVLPGEDQFSVAGRVSLLITAATEKWPTVFLEDVVPAEFVQAMQQSEVQSGPDLRISSMVPRPLDEDPPRESRLGENQKRSVRLVPFVLFCSLLRLFIIFPNYGT